MMKLFKFLNGLPGIVLACLATLGAFQAYVSMRERIAVERAAWAQQRDALRATMAADQIAADTRDRRRVDSIAHLTARIRSAVADAGAHARGAEAFSDTLHALVDSNAAARAALDSLEAHHAAEVLDLHRALAIADSVHQVDQAAVADRDAQLKDVRRQLVAAITKADGFEKQAHPGWIRTVLEHPVTHLVAAGIGYELGRK